MSRALATLDRHLDALRWRDRIPLILTLALLVATLGVWLDQFFGGLVHYRRIEGIMSNIAPSGPPPFLLASVTPDRTGLPFVVWFSNGDGDTDHDVRIWVSRGPVANPAELVTVEIRPDVRVVDGKLSAREMALLRQWLAPNLPVLVRYWDGDIESSENAIAAMRPVKRRPPSQSHSARPTASMSPHS